MALRRRHGESPGNEKREKGFSLSLGLSGGKAFGLSLGLPFRLSLRLPVPVVLAREVAQVLVLVRRHHRLQRPVERVTKMIPQEIEVCPALWLFHVRDGLDSDADDVGLRLSVAQRREDREPGTLAGVIWCEPGHGGRAE